MFLIPPLQGVEWPSPPLKHGFGKFPQYRISDFQILPKSAEADFSAPFAYRLLGGILRTVYLVEKNMACRLFGRDT